MHRFYLPPEQCPRDGPLLLTGREAHHALHVLRLRPGDPVTVLDGAGGEFACEVQGRDGSNLSLAVRTRHNHPPPLGSISLLQALPKGKLIESIIQKATELGVARIVPLLSERVATRLDPPDAATKAVKWQQVAVEALKQCGSAWLPRVEEPVAPADFLARQEPFDLALIGSLQPGALHPRVACESFRARHHRNPASLAVWIGPEGDFAPAELAAIQAAGATPITLGPLVLRTETAAIYTVSVLNYELTAPGGVPASAPAPALGTHAPGFGGE